MSSPAASGLGDASAKKPLEQITFRFCSECSNMLYPKEDENERKLLFTCRTCNYSTDATSSCIYRNILNNKAGETAGVTQDVGSDPTVGNPQFLLIKVEAQQPDEIAIKEEMDFYIKSDVPVKEEEVQLEFYIKSEAPKKRECMCGICMLCFLEQGLDPSAKLYSENFGFLDWVVEPVDWEEETDGDEAE